MKIGSVFEDQNLEKRVSITPEIAKKYGWKPTNNLDYGFDLTLRDFLKKR